MCHLIVTTGGGNYVILPAVQQHCVKYIEQGWSRKYWLSCPKYFFIFVFEATTHNKTSSRASQALMSMSLLLHCTHMQGHT